MSEKMSVFSPKLSATGLPDGLFFKPKIPIWENIKGLGMNKVGLFYGHLEYIMASWYIL
jgi:hypothetical protein